MGVGMAGSLRRQGFEVVGTDIDPDRRDLFAGAGGSVAADARTAAAEADVTISVVITGEQTEALLFGSGAVAQAVPAGGIFVSCATMARDQAKSLGGRAAEAGIAFLDAPISGGARGAEAGALTIMASGPRRAFDAAKPALDAMGERVFWLGEEAGLGAAMKTINQLPAGANLVTACEAITLAIRLGLDPVQVDEIISGAAGNSWMWQDRIKPLVAGDHTVRSAIEIFVKDMGIVVDTARGARFPVPGAPVRVETPGGCVYVWRHGSAPAPRAPGSRQDAPRSTAESTEDRA